MKSLSTVLTCLLLLFLGCTKTHDCVHQDDDSSHQDHNKCTEWADAILENKVGTDGCGWVFRENDGRYLEPINLLDFEIDLVNGKSVFINYVERKDMVSICMIGKVVELKCIKE